MSVVAGKDMGRLVIFLIVAFALENVRVAKVGASLSNFKSFQSLLPTERQPYRTAYHFQPPRNWMNDPNGPMYYKGVYHLMYQYNPDGPLFGDIIVWGHSVSYDLINWVHLGPALFPTGEFDINSCFSGSATILPGNKPVILYTGVDSQRRQVQNLARPENMSDPFLRKWVKYSGNPILTPPEGVNPDSFRDPSTAWQGRDGVWRIVVGSEVNSRGTVFLYQSRDFVHWELYRRPFYSLEKTGTWECPDFFPVSIDSENGVENSVLNSSIRHVMKVGFDSRDWYTIGTYNPEIEHYVPQNDLRGNNLDLSYDYGKFYASKSFLDTATNRRLLWGWVNESDSTEDALNKGWSGLQTIPRRVWLDRNGKQLVQWPVQEIESLRREEVTFRNHKIESGSLLEVSGITASQADVSVSFRVANLEEAETMDPKWVDPQLICSQKGALERGKIGPFGLFVLASKDLTEQTAIFFRVFKGNGKFVVLMCSDQSRSSATEGIDKTTYGAFVDVDPRREEISLRSLIDHSIVESFGGGGKACITTRAYPKLAVDEEARLFAFNYGTQSVDMPTLSAWSMKKAQLRVEDDSKGSA